MLDIMILPHFFHLNMLPNNLSKICVRNLTLLLAFPIAVLLTSSKFTSDGISSDLTWEEWKLKELWVQVESFDLPFQAAFTLSILLPIIPFWSSWTVTNFTFFSMSSPVVEWWCAYSTLPFDGSRHDRITLVADFIRVCLWIVTICIHKIHFFTFVFIVFLIVIFFPKKLTADST